MKSYNKICLIAAIIVSIIINGCNPKTIPLKGNYVTNPIEFTSAKSSDSLWLDVTHVFAEKGLDVKKIDKKKGLIVSQETSFISAYTFEDKDGKLKDPEAWVVLQKVFIKKKEWEPKTIYSEWSIQINQIENGVTLIKLSPFIVCIYHPNMFTSAETRGQSTGNLEKLINSTLLK